ncbi:LysR family transcriptional regulator [Atopobium fossor]|uniref:LysR family transcriptional regulator n=1 Tax=Atopobium fossor TaxID=39487 RepID=UPI00040C47A0|nr:LysR family transcriptional regulator [Atopobium fossor]
MNLQQLRYIIAIAESGSMNSVAKTHFIAQSSLSVAVKDLEQELGITIFTRTSKGIRVTREGVEFLGYARQVVEQADLLQSRYAGHPDQLKQRLSISSQHYAFVVRAFTEFVRTQEGSGFDFILRETRTTNIINDVADFRSDIGILFLSSYNEQALRRRFDENNLKFASLYKAKPHVFVRKDHPLAALPSIKVSALASWPRYTFEQGTQSSLYLSEEPFSYIPHAQNVVVSDRGTMTSLLANYNGFLISTGMLSDEMSAHIVSIPLETDEIMNVGYLTHSQRKLSEHAQEFISMLKQLIAAQ